MNTYIYLVRHGEVHNPNNIWYGRLPRYGLTKRGEEEIAQTAKFLKQKPINELYASPLLRAKKTAEIIQKEIQVPQITLTEHLLEVKSSYMGQPLSVLQEIKFDIFNAPGRHKSDETLEQLAERSVGFIDHLFAKHTGQHVVAVSHGDILMTVKAVLKGMPLEIDSIRTGKGFRYVRHGEVLQITTDEKGKKTIESIFIPDSKTY
jgi:broad specificity phosphatase PhoE